MCDVVDMKVVIVASPKRWVMWLGYRVELRYQARASVRVTRKWTRSVTVDHVGMVRMQCARRVELETMGMHA